MVELLPGTAAGMAVVKRAFPEQMKAYTTQSDTASNLSPTTPATSPSPGPGPTPTPTQPACRTLYSRSLEHRRPPAPGPAPVIRVEQLHRRLYQELNRLALSHGGNVSVVAVAALEFATELTRALRDGWVSFNSSRAFPDRGSWSSAATHLGTLRTILEDVRRTPILLTVFREAITESETEIRAARPCRCHDDPNGTTECYPTIIHRILFPRGLCMVARVGALPPSRTQGQGSPNLG